MEAIVKTDFSFPGQTGHYVGKVRDVYSVEDKLVMVATDRISAFDVVLPKGIPFKGQMLNQIAAKFLDATADICPNWKMATPDPMVTVGVRCEGFAVEMIVRGYLCGSAWRAYKSGVREICGVRLPEGMKENQKFPTPIITPTTKAEIGEHDADISKEEILAQGLATPEEYELLEKYTLALFQRGSEIAAERGLILVDTKYEFGKHNGTIYLMDEIHTPDSSRYFYAEGYQERFEAGEPQKQLSKEFVREWLMENGFQGTIDEWLESLTREDGTDGKSAYEIAVENGFDGTEEQWKKIGGCYLADVRIQYNYHKHNYKTTTTKATKTSKTRKETTTGYNDMGTDNSLEDATYSIKTVISAVYLHPQPTSASENLCVIPVGAECKVYTNENGWLYLDYNGQKGYAYYSFFTE